MGPKAAVHLSLQDESHYKALDPLFPKSADGTPTRTESFTDTEFKRIAEVLNLTRKIAWGKVPRTYALLRMIGRLDHLDDLIALNVTDINIPYSTNNLPSCLSPSARSAFRAKQHLVLTNSMELERGRDGQHVHIENLDNLQLETRGFLGEGGGCARVEKVFSAMSCRLYALKLIRRATAFPDDKEAITKFEDELNKAKKARHRHIAEIAGSFTSPEYVGILMSTIGDCNLEDFLQKAVSADQKSLLRSFFGCLVSGLMAIHEVQIRHKDIKPKNILIKDSRVYITDFGIARDWSDSGKSTTGGKVLLCTPRYASPEVDDHQRRGSSADIWSLSIVFLEMTTTLLGCSVATMTDYLEKNGSLVSNVYARNIQGLEKWINHLRNTSSKQSDTAPLDWILACLKPAKLRPTAHRLWELIDQSAFTTGLPFACSLCATKYDKPGPTVMKIDTIISPLSKPAPASFYDSASADSVNGKSRPNIVSSLGSPDSGYLSSSTPERRIGNAKEDYDEEDSDDDWDDLQDEFIRLQSDGKVTETKYRHRNMKQDSQIPARSRIITSNRQPSLTAPDTAQEPARNPKTNSPPVKQTPSSPANMNRPTHSHAPQQTDIFQLAKPAFSLYSTPYSNESQDWGQLEILISPEAAALAGDENSTSMSRSSSRSKQ